MAQHVTDAQHLATTCFCIQFLIIIKVRFIPINKVCRWLCEPDVHEPQCTDVRGIAVIQ